MIDERPQQDWHIVWSRYLTGINEGRVTGYTEDEDMAALAMLDAELEAQERWGDVAWAAEASGKWLKKKAKTKKAGK